VPGCMDLRGTRWHLRVRDLSGVLRDELRGRTLCLLLHAAGVGQREHLHLHEPSLRGRLREPHERHGVAHCPP
jgi:hypothetical protein